MLCPLPVYTARYILRFYYRKFFCHVNALSNIFLLFSTPYLRVPSDHQTERGRIVEPVPKKVKGTDIETLPEAGDSRIVSTLLSNDLGEDHAVQVTLYDDAEEIPDAFDEASHKLEASSGSTSQDTETLIASGSCGDSPTWSLNSKYKLTISGAGAMTNYSSGTAPWYTYRENITSLVLDDGLTSIGDYAFYNCSGFDGTLTLSNALTSLASYAFKNCSGITGELVVPDTLDKLNTGVFSGMKNIPSLVIGEGVTSIYTTTYYSYISDNAFYGFTE